MAAAEAWGDAGLYSGLLIAPKVEDDDSYVFEHNPLRNALLAAGVVLVCVAIPYLGYVLWSLPHGN